MILPRWGLRTAIGIAAIALSGGLLGCSTSRDEDGLALARSGVAQDQIVGMRRLTESQYRNVIADIFGGDIKVGGRFDPIVRPERGLIATAASQSTVSPAGFEQFDAMARTIAGQVLDDQHRATFLSCTPADPTKADPACARLFFREVGPLLYRRPLTAAELEFYVGLSERGAAPQKNFYEGLKLSLAAMMVSPEFLYRVESVAPDGKALEVGLRSLRWLASVQTTTAGHFRPVGSNGFYPRDGARADYDQQPVEAQAMVAACHEAFRATQDPLWSQEAKRAFEWFLGRNDLGQPLYDFSTGGCSDGLHEDRVSENQGAESTLAFHLSLADMNAAEHLVSVSPSGRQGLPDKLHSLN